MIDTRKNMVDCLSDKQADRIIIIPYADLDNANTGVNIKKQGNRKEIYLKNCCVALLSAKHYNADSDVALVTNIEVPTTYKNLLINNNIKIIKADFDSFRFTENYTWALAFYKLCALKYVLSKFDYKYISYLDSDVYVQSSFENIWKECDYNIMLYDINHGLQVVDYRKFMDETFSFLNNREYITHYGGEFFAAKRENALNFIVLCEKIFSKMIEQNTVTQFGDEFILCIAANEYKNNVKNAGAYVYRYWTDSFRLVSTNYERNRVTVLHVPDEKQRGMIKLFDNYYKKSRIPALNKVYKYLSLSRLSLVTKMKITLKNVLKKYEIYS